MKKLIIVLYTLVCLFVGCDSSDPGCPEANRPKCASSCGSDLLGVTDCESRDGAFPDCINDKWDGGSRIEYSSCY